MKVFVNNKETELIHGNTVADLAEQLSLPEHGVAIAVQNHMIPRSEWSTNELQEGASLVIIKAACGG